MKNKLNKKGKDIKVSDIPWWDYQHVRNKIDIEEDLENNRIYKSKSYCKFFIAKKVEEYWFKSINLNTIKEEIKVGLKNDDSISYEFKWVDSDKYIDNIFKNEIKDLEFEEKEIYSFHFKEPEDEWELFNIFESKEDLLKEVNKYKDREIYWYQKYKTLVNKHTWKYIWVDVSQYDIVDLTEEIKKN